MKTKQIGSLFIPVNNLERSIAFYTEALGLVCRGIEDWGGDSRGATLFFQPHPEDAALLSLAELKEPIPVMAFPSFNIKCADVRALHAELQARGCRVSDIETWDSEWNHHVLFDVFDPDGHMVGLVEMVPIAAAAAVVES
ncbi:VOC family protein [Paenibacillus sacheonensis]|uniref:VOC family protein n=1 Tax=Paenibacillus sacheonensis TaxID=742054 RepID=A0A7X4YR15_9BACL|nr:VOC family protein [Paenibacillus sacheonensis]MBM7567110.1 catechol 2,3-dioxygenase-like lactoylglutathione lyase family enzyme [Paenibacillus sacheonensis]NBC70961.1 VOC family protein [Paenibacillus sacheonensis]